MADDRRYEDAGAEPQPLPRTRARALDLDEQERAGLRDRFAMAAIREAMGGHYKADYIAKRAYQIADAMLAERGA